MTEPELPSDPVDLLSAEDHREMQEALNRIAETRRRAERESRDLIIG